MSVVEALVRDLEALGPAARESALAATALALAERLDDPETLGSAMAGLARELRETLDGLRALADQKPQKRSTVDEIRARRERAAASRP